MQVLKMLAVYIAAAAIFDTPENKERVDLKQHYYETRAVTWGALIIGLLLFSAYGLLFYARRMPSLFAIAEILSLPALYGTLIAFRWRPWHLLVLIGVNVFWTLQIVNVRIH